MSTKFKVLRRMAGAPGAPSGATTVTEGELAFNASGNTVGDVNSLHMGLATAGSTALLVSKDRQVETAGIQGAIAGKKTFLELAFGNAATTNDMAFPTTRGTSHQVLRLNAAADALEFVNATGLSTLAFTVAGTGDVWTDLNAMDFTGQNGLTSPTITSGPTALYIFSHDGSAFLWTGASTGGKLGSGGDVTAVAADLTALGSAVDFASDAVVKAGALTAVAVSPRTLGDNYLRSSDSAGTDVPQTLHNSLTMDHALTMSGDINLQGNSISGTDDGTRFNMAFGEVKTADAIKVSGAVSSVISGDSATINQLDKFVLDAGSY